MVGEGAYPDLVSASDQIAVVNAAGKFGKLFRFERGRHLSDFNLKTEISGRDLSHARCVCKYAPDV